MTDTEKLKRYTGDEAHDHAVHSAYAESYYIASEADALIASLRSALLAAEGRVKELEREIEDDRVEHAHAMKHLADYGNNDMARIQAEQRAKALEPNARRYEWLRSQAQQEDSGYTLPHIWGWVGPVPREWADFDTAIDSHLAALESGEGK